MCNRYPNCSHAGPVHAEIAGYPRHCETVLPNSDCSYHARGCLGCTFKPIHGSAGIVLNLRRFQPPVDWADEVAKLKRGATIEMQPSYINDDALLALVAGAWKAYCMLQGLVSAGVVSQDWASKSLRNVIQYTYRQAVCRVIAAYLDTRSNDQ